MDNNSNDSNSGDEQTITIVIILIAAIVIFFLVVAWCGFFYGLWRNRKVALDMSRIHQYREQQYRRHQLQKQQQQQQQRSPHNPPRQLLQQQQHRPQQQQQLQQQLRKQLQLNANRSRPPSQLSSKPSHTDVAYQQQLNLHQPQLNMHQQQLNPHQRQFNLNQSQLSSYPQMPYYGDRVSVHSGYVTPAAVPTPVFIPPRDYDDDDTTPLHSTVHSPISSSGLDHSYHNRTFDYFEGSSSQNQSFTNIGYQSNASSYPDDTVGPDRSNFRSQHSPTPPRSTSTPLVPKMRAQHKRISQPASFDNYSMEMQQYQQLQHWPQNY